jgi:hypothetical protein
VVSHGGEPGTARAAYHGGDPGAAFGKVRSIAVTTDHGERDRHENAVKLAGGLQIGALVNNLANRGGLDAQAPQCSFFLLFLFFSAAILWKIWRVGLDRCLPPALRAAVRHVRTRLG